MITLYITLQWLSYFISHSVVELCGERRENVIVWRTKCSPLDSLSLKSRIKNCPKNLWIGNTTETLKMWTEFKFSCTETGIRAYQVNESESNKGVFFTQMTRPKIQKSFQVSPIWRGWQMRTQLFTMCRAPNRCGEVDSERDNQKQTLRLNAISPLPNWHTVNKCHFV